VSGFLFEGVRWFESTNIASHTYNVAIQGAKGFTGNTAKQNPAALMMFFGPQSIGIGIGGNNAQVALNSNDDFSRFVILIWLLYAGWEVLNMDFVTIAHSFLYSI
jgi:hypothetical protein